MFRSPSIILQRPTNFDFTLAVNFYILYLNKIDEMKEKERRIADEKALEKQKKEEEEHRKAERIAQLKLLKEQERLELERLKKAQIDDLKNKIAERKRSKLEIEEKKAQELAYLHKSKQASKKKSTHTLFSKTSHCHESRETIDTVYCIKVLYFLSIIYLLWIIGDFERCNKSSNKNLKSLNTSLSLHFAAFNKSLTIDRVSLDPFSQYQHSGSQASQESDHIAVKKRTNYLTYSTQKPKNLDDEISYIRNGNFTFNQKPSIQETKIRHDMLPIQPHVRNYFVPSLAWMPSSQPDDKIIEEPKKK